MRNSNPMLMKLNRFLLLPESSSSPQLQSPSPAPISSPDENILFLVITILDQLKEWVSATVTATATATFPNSFSSVLEAYWVTKAATFATLIIVGALLLLSLFFFPVPTLLVFKWAAISLFYICVFALGLLWLTCRFIFASVTAMCRCLLSSEMFSFFASAASAFRVGTTGISWSRHSILPENLIFSEGLSPGVDEHSDQHPAYGYNCGARNKPKSNPYSRPENHFFPQGSGGRNQCSGTPPPQNHSEQDAGVRQPEKQWSSGAKGKKKCNPDDRRSSSNVSTDRQKMKENYEYRRAMEAEWAARQQVLRRQAEEARRQRSSKRAENKQTKANERRQKQQRKPGTSRKDDENLNVEKERIREDIRKKLSQVEKSCGNMASLLKALGIPLALNPSQKQIRAAYREACRKFHPDRLTTTDLRHQVEAEEKFKLISAMNHSFYS